MRTQDDLNEVRGQLIKAMMENILNVEIDSHLGYEAAEYVLDEFSKRWGRSWRSHWDKLMTIFDYPAEIRKVIYTTNAIESLNSVIRKDSLLGIEKASEQWTMPIRNWIAVMNILAMAYEGRFNIENEVTQNY